MTGNTLAIDSPGSGRVAYTFDGSHLTAATWTGLINGTVGRAYDNSFRVAALSVNGLSVGLTYDADDLIVGAGALTLSRSAQNGLITGTALGNVEGCLDVRRFRCTHRIQRVFQYNCDFCRSV